MNAALLALNRMTQAYASAVIPQLRDRGYNKFSLGAVPGDQGFFLKLTAMIASR
jgi:hypothetical protein